MIPLMTKWRNQRTRRAPEELGFKTVFIGPKPPFNGRNWHDPYYDPLWAEIKNLGIPLSFHEGGEWIYHSLETISKPICLSHLHSSNGNDAGGGRHSRGGVLEFFP
ncbi:MAG: hypothetical protein Ct9H300mP11_29150 [Chloroflexota bacterium]|nr:MAG: hypothetical protein Ct9H300mP11_29150 [Chloroflexota bacterium]